MKDCWSQDASELEECLEDDECVANSRTTGSKDLAAKFCCCRTHACNQNLSFRFPEPSDEPNIVHPSPTGHWLPVFILSTAGFSVLITVLVLSSILALCGITYWAIHRRNKHDKFENKLSSNGLSLASVEHGHETSALLTNTTESLREITLLEKASTGRFSEVYKGRLGSNVFAVKVLPATAIDSWVNEQDVYALKAIRSHPHLVDFVAAFQNNDKYWLVTVYHENGSLSDYLRKNVLSLEVAMKFLTTMLSGLAFLHDESVVGEETKPSVVHRDFKSKNVLIKDDLTTCITDFGLALKCENGRMSEESHGQVGTRRYMAPEVLEGATEFSAFAFQQIDVYAAGLVMWEILSRTRVPEDGDDAVPDYLLPYEKEAGPSPSLGQIRELVVMRKFRPEVREAHLQNKSTRTIVKTIREMWDMEPDGRITSGCASDRMTRLYESLQSSTPSSGSREEHDNEACDLSS
ncbi:TKL/STKR/TYPE2 protein kinase [Aphelenchoides avenae]|nr:TKL/STKR/TYPE2 protein kinase [Aphelenchus avenae]